MSWFTEIAGKAEDLLNRVDQTAATALQSKSKSHSYDPPSNFSKLNPSDVSYESNYSNKSAYLGSQRTSAATLKTSTATPKTRFTSGESKQSYTPGVLTPRKKPESDDEKLLRFLNCSETLPPQSRKPKLKESDRMEVQSTSSSSDVLKTIVDDNKELDVLPNDLPTDEVCSSQSSENLITNPAENSEDIPATIMANSCTEATNISSAPTHEELLLAQNQAQHAEAEMKRMMKKLDHWNSQISGNDKVARELREQVKDMAAAMDAKDSQLAILKVRLQEADQELLIKQNIIEELKQENERIVKSHAEDATFQNKTVEIMREQSQQTEIELNKTRESFNKFQTEHMQQMSRMEEEHRHLVENYSSLQRKWSELNERNKDLISQVKNANSNFDTLQLEYNDYKQKAQRILQSKEKLILTLKEGNFDADSIEKNEASSALLNAEVEGVKQERDLLREELRRANELIESYRSEVQELEKISQNDLASSQERCRILKEQLEMEKLQKEEMNLSNAQLKEELQLLREDLTRTKSSFQSRIQDREIEIEKLRRQLTAKSLSTVSQDELESRLHALTENLIQKQTVVEALSTEKNSLVLQLERLEQQLREAQNFGMQQQHTYVGINNNEAERKTKAIFLENPFDSALTRRVKRVYGSIDSLSIRLGLFFRRYPITRVFVIIYMLLLHFWVMIVLLTYEPEIHGATYEGTKH